MTIPKPTTARADRAPTSIAARAGHAFPSHATVHGFAHHSRGEVSIDAVESHRVTAHVRGKRKHEVALTDDDGALCIACSCPGRSLGVLGCAHAWAVLLEVDRRGGLDALRARADAVAVRAVEPVPTKAHQAERSAKPAKPARRTKPAKAEPAKKIAKRKR